MPITDNEKLYDNATIILYNNDTLSNINTTINEDEEFLHNNWWALSALFLVIGTAAGNILVCLAICWERHLQNVTNYFLMSLAITDLMVAILVMPLGILTLVRGYFPLPSIYCLAWICLDVLFCTASIMHLCTISVDRYLSLSYPMKFGRNKSRRRVILKIVFVWLLSIAMSLPLSLMYSKDQDSLIIDGTCQIPDPLYKLIGSIVSFYIPLLVMLVTYALTVRLLAHQSKNLDSTNWSSNWMGGPPSFLERRCTWRKILNPTKAPSGGSSGSRKQTTPQHVHHSAASTDTELTTIDTHELWIQESEPTHCTMSALGQFGAEMLKLSRGLGATSQHPLSTTKNNALITNNLTVSLSTTKEHQNDNLYKTNFSLLFNRRRASTFHHGDTKDESPSPKWRRRSCSFQELTTVQKTSLNSILAQPQQPPPHTPCTYLYFGDTNSNKLLSKVNNKKLTPPKVTMRNRDSSPQNNVVVTWEAKRHSRRGSSFGNTKTTILNNQKTPLLRRAVTMRYSGPKSTITTATTTLGGKEKNPSSPCLAQQQYNHNNTTGTNIRNVRSHHSRNSSVISRNSSRHGRIIRLEQKATKVLGVVFFTFVILWAPFFILNLLPAFCMECDKNLSYWVMPLVTWLGYASSLVNPIFYTIFNKVFRQAFKKVLTCQYRKPVWHPYR